MPAHPQPHVPTPTPTHPRRQLTPAHPPRATHSPAPRVAHLPAQHAGGGWGGGEARQGGLMEGWAGLGRRAGRGCRAALTPAPRCACARRADGGRCDHVAGAALFCFYVPFFVQSRVCCAPIVFSPWLGAVRPLFSISERVPRRCPHPWLHMRMLNVICNVGSSIYIISVLVYHSLTHLMTWEARLGRFQPSRGGGNSIGDRFPLAAGHGPALAQGGVTVTRLIC